MKTPLLTAFTIIFLCLSACQDQNSTFTPLNTSGEVWSLVSYEPTYMVSDVISKSSQQFSLEQVTWQFDTSQNQVTIQIQSGINFDLFEEGTYAYRIEQIEGSSGEVIYINDQYFGSYKENSRELLISNIAADGPVMWFVKLNQQKD